MSKGFYVAGVVLVLVAGSAWGQYGYLYQSGGWMFGAQFIGQEGWMVGGGGAILHTLDGGRNWIFQRNIQGYDAANPGIFCAVTFKNQRLGWALSSTSPVVWRTTDGGQYWAAESLPSVSRPSSKVSFADTLSGWIVCPGLSTGYILASTDGGRTWTIQIQIPSHFYEGVFAGSPRQCWAVGYSGWVARTTDGGQNWLEQQIVSQPSLYDVHFSDTLYGWACGYSGAVVHTTDGGVSWTAQTSGTARALQALAFLDRSKGFAVGDTGTLLKTTDGGANWTSIPTGIDVELAAITFGDSLHGWAVGVEGGAILETGDGGSTWRVSRKGIAGPVATPFPGRRTERVQAISFVDDSTGWAATWEGNIWHTLDGGKIWSKQYSVSPKKLLGLAMADANTGWAVGDSEMIIKTQDGGINWITQRMSYLKWPLTNVFTSDPQHAWACGEWDNFFRTSNGGVTWDSLFQYFPYQCLNFPFAAVKALASVDTLFGWALFEDGSLWVTTNSGMTWGPRGSLWSLAGWQHLSFVDSTWGWAVSGSGINRSTDGGWNWQNQNSTSGLKDIAGGSRMKAWAVGNSGLILATTDGGSTWVSQTAPIAPNLLAVTFADTLHGIAGGSGDLILVTQNGGALWDTVRVSNSGTKDVFLIDTLYGWLVGSDGNARRTANGGRTWQTLLTKTNLAAVHFANRNLGWVAQQNYNVWRTMDGGTTWDSLRIIPEPGGMNVGAYDIRVLNDRIGWCAIGSYSNPSYSGSLKATTDRGIHWANFNQSSVRLLNNNPTGSSIATTSACFVGPGGRVAMRVRGDLTWDLAPVVQESLGYGYLQRPPSLWSMDFLNSRQAWAVGQYGTCMVTTDGGVSWRLQKIDRSLTPVDSLLTSVQAFDAQTARATGYLGRSVLTTDGGATWVGEETGTDEWLLASSFLSPTLGWVAGEDGMVLKYGLLPSGVEAVQGGTPNPWITALEQNRPNPFQDKTGIRYQLARKEHVKLIVYNVLGQAERRLVDGTQTPGAYVVSWDGRDGADHPLPSGVYFYRLEAGGQGQTRKLVKVR